MLQVCNCSYQSLCLFIYIAVTTPNFQSIGKMPEDKDFSKIIFNGCQKGMFIQSSQYAVTTLFSNLAQ